MALFLGILLVVGLIGLACLYLKSGDDGVGIPSLSSGIVIGVVFFITSVIYPIYHASSLQEMIVFYEVNSEAYATAVTETRAILSEEKFIESFIVEGSIEKAGVGTAISERIAEWRDAIVTYNSSLKQFQYWDSNIWLGIYFPTPPEELKFLSIGGRQ